MSEERTILGLLVLTVGGEEVEVPKLKLRSARAWRRRALEAYGRWAGVDLEPTDLVATAGVLDEVETAMLDLIAEYDVTGVLGGREGLEDRFLPGEVAAAFNAMLASSLPFDLAAQLAAAEPASARSTNGRSPTGASIPTASRSASTPGS
jgi:hypothetical protein